MAHLYCTECGAKNIYSLKKPNFCSSCGFAFESVGTEEKPIKQRAINEGDLDEEGSEVFEVPDFDSSKLSYEVDYEGIAKIHKPSEWFLDKNSNLEETSAKKKKTNIRGKHKKN